MHVVALIKDYIGIKDFDELLIRNTEKLELKSEMTSALSDLGMGICGGLIRKQIAADFKIHILSLFRLAHPQALPKSKNARVI